MVVTTTTTGRRMTTVMMTKLDSFSFSFFLTEKTFTEFCQDYVAVMMIMMMPC